MLWNLFGQIGKVKDVIFSWRNWMRKHLSAIRNMIPLGLMWTTWREYNQRTFEDVESVVSNFL